MVKSFSNPKLDKTMKFITKLILIVVVSVSCKAQVPQNGTISEFHENLKLESDYHEKFKKEHFLVFYGKHKDEFWKKDDQRQLWKDLVPFLKSYKDDSVIESLLKDIDLSEYSEGTLFGWSPFVMASTNSKMYYVLNLIYHVEGVGGISKYYHNQKKKILDSDKNTSPVHFSVLTGLVCSLPDVKKDTEKIELSKIVIDYFIFMSSKFLKSENSSKDSSVAGFKEGMLSYYFYEKQGSNNSKSSPYGGKIKSWPNRGKSFNVRKYFDSLELKAQKSELSDEERDIVNKVQGVIKNLSQNK